MVHPFAILKRTARLNWQARLNNNTMASNVTTSYLSFILRAALR